MPCDAIAFARIVEEQTRTKEEFIDLMRTLLARERIEYVRKELIWHLKTYPVPIQIAFEPPNTLTVITRQGTFKVGKSQIEALIALLKSGGMLSPNVKAAIETHVHQDQPLPPKLAYTTAVSD